jgi:hypothetical protein
MQRAIVRSPEVGGKGRASFADRDALSQIARLAIAACNRGEL